MEGNMTANVVRFKDLITLDDSSEYLKRFYFK
jgi:hypothetical protein